jgi:hypothetical protein
MRIDRFFVIQCAIQSSEKNSLPFIRFIDLLLILFHLPPYHSSIFFSCFSSSSAYENKLTFTFQIYTDTLNEPHFILFTVFASFCFTFTTNRYMGILAYLLANDLLYRDTGSRHRYYIPIYGTHSLTLPSDASSFVNTVCIEWALENKYCTNPEQPETQITVTRDTICMRA